MNQTQTEPLLEIRNLSTWFPVRRGVFARVAGQVKAVDGVSLSIGRGETLGLVGESGCGKTTLGRTIIGLEKAREGVVDFHGERMQMIFQDPYSALNPRMSILDLVTEGMIHHGLMKGTKEEEGERLLGDVGMDASAFYRFPFEFSGGQRQRICIARALSLRPSLLICDEAVSSLDVSVQAQVINLLLDLKDKYGLSYLFISHDLSVVRFIADRVAVMYLGKIVEEGPTAQVMDAALHPYTQALLSAAPVPGVEKKARIVLQGDVPSPARPPPGCPFHTRCPKVMPQCATVPPETRHTQGRDVNCHLY